MLLNVMCKRSDGMLRWKSELIYSDRNVSSKINESEWQCSLNEPYFISNLTVCKRLYNENNFKINGNTFKKHRKYNLFH